MCVFKIKPIQRKKTEISYYFAMRLKKKSGRMYACVYVRFCLGYDFSLVTARSLKISEKHIYNLYMCAFIQLWEIL